MILYIGNILSSKGLNPPPIESMKDKICESIGKKMILVSNKRRESYLSKDAKNMKIDAIDAK